jgi:thiol-disulfide isomerase/thioredoxin
MPNLAEYMMKNKLLVLAFSVILAVSGNALAQKNTLVSMNQTASLQTLDGEVVSLPTLKGKVVVLAIGASWLPLSKQQIITTNKLAKKYAGKDVVIYWVSTDSSNAKSKNYASDEQIKAFGVKNKLTSTILRDSDGLATLKKFAVDQLPSFVILDKTGKSIGEPFSGLDPDNEAEIYTQIVGAIDKVL